MKVDEMRVKVGSMVNKTKLMGRAPRKTREQLNEEGRALKRSKKRKGLPAGSRTNLDRDNKNLFVDSMIRDPRLGSKKAINLHKTESTSTPIKKTPLSAQQRLAELENDPYLEQLLQKNEDGIELTIDEQRYLDHQLNQIEKLMDKLGLLSSLESGSEDHPDEILEDLMPLLKGR